MGVADLGLAIGTRSDAWTKRWGSAALMRQAFLALRQFGTDAHVWVPGVGYFNGLEAGNYIDSAGTQAGLVDNPVGLVMDAEGSLGTELVTNGDFSNGSTGWTVGSEWTISGGSAAVVGTGLFTNLDQVTNASIAGKVYVLKFEVVSLTGGTIRCSFAGAPLDTSTSTIGQKAVYFTAASTTGLVRFQVGNGASATIDNISVREVTGAITATQGTTANKPILRRGAVNLLTYSEQFDNAAWVKDQSSLDANTAVAPNSTQTADYIKEDGTTNVHQVRGNFTVISGATYNFSVYIKAGNRTWASFSFSNPTASVFFNLTNGAIGTTTGSVSGSVISVGNGWYRCSATVTATATTLTARIQAATSDNTNFYLGDGTSGIYIWGAQLELGSTASDYIPTTTAAASSSSGNYYWQFDGSNDSLALSSVPFQTQDDFAVITGIRPTVIDATNRRFFHSSGTTSLIQIYVSATTGYIAFTMTDDAGVVVSPAATTAPSVSVSSVITGRKVGNTKTARLNGSVIGTTSTVQGSSTNTSASIGAITGGVNVFNGSIYPVIAIKGTVSDADLLILERWVGSLSGVSI